DELDRPPQRLRRTRPRLPVRSLWRAAGGEARDLLLELGIVGLGRPVRVDADGVDHAIAADPARHLADQLDRVVALQVDDLGALLPRGLHPVRKGVDSDHAAGSEVLRAPDRELADRPAPEHADDVALVDL